MTAVEATPITKEEQSKPLALRVGAELVGSFIICFAIYAICSLGSAVYGINMAFIALLTGIVYAAVTVIFGSISGAQFNPAVSVAAMLTGKTHVLDGILYIIARARRYRRGCRHPVPSADFRAGDIQDLDDTNGQRFR